MTSHTYTVPYEALQTICLVRDICAELVARNVPGVDYFDGFPRRITVCNGNVPSDYPTPELAQEITRVSLWFQMVGYVDAVAVGVDSPNGTYWEVVVMTIRPRGGRAMRLGCEDIRRLNTALHRRDTSSDLDNPIQLAAQAVADRILREIPPVPVRDPHAGDEFVEVVESV